MRSPMPLVLMALACSGGKDEAAESGGGESSSPGDTSEGGDDTGAATLCPEDVIFSKSGSGIPCSARTASGATTVMGRHPVREWCSRRTTCFTTCEPPRASRTCSW